MRTSLAWEHLLPIFTLFSHKVNTYPPKQAGAYTLNFHGRVTEPSVKNFQMVEKDGDRTTLVQFGKTGRDTFALDFRYPISPFQAFAMCLTSFHA